MNNNLNKKKYISEDEGAGNAAPIIEVFSSLFIILFLIWFLFDLIKRVMDKKILNPVK